MNEPIVSLDRIKCEAVLAASKVADVNHACPYPFTTEAGRVFKAYFMEARKHQQAHHPLSKTTHPTRKDATQ